VETRRPVRGVEVGHFDDGVRGAPPPPSTQIVDVQARTVPWWKISCHVLPVCRQIELRFVDRVAERRVTPLRVLKRVIVTSDAFTLPSEFIMTLLRVLMVRMRDSLCTDRLRRW
jgi:hypothetical protein